MTKLAAILDQIDSGSVLLPEFQRGYVWNRDQVRGLMRSLYLGYPVGGLLTWETQADGAAVRGDTAGQRGLRVLILAGQQRITSLYGVSRGRPPAFFQGDAKAFTGLHFHVEDESFEFYAPAKMRDDPRWIDVTALFAKGLEPHIAVLSSHPATQHRFAAYMERLVRLRALVDREFHEDKITGEDKTVDVVVDIFNRVNSGGTKLSKGDLALAKKCAHWPEARAVMRAHLDKWEKDGFSFSLDWLLRNATAVATGRSEFASLDNVQVPAFRTSLDASAKYVSRITASPYAARHCMAISRWARERGAGELEVPVAGNAPESLSFAHRRGFTEERRQVGLVLSLAGISPLQVRPPATPAWATDQGSGGST